MPRSIFTVLLLVAIVVSTNAFQPRIVAIQRTGGSTTKKSTSTSIFYNEHPDKSNHRISTKSRKPEGPMECYLVIDDEEDEDDHLHYDKPHVVCTSAPDEYAWFNGIDPDKMVPTDGTETGAMECVEGASPRGIPEWECE